MDLALFIRGLIVGLAIAAPVGPIGVLCVRRTLAEGRTVGFVSGLGAASADAVYGGIAGFGLTFITSALVAQHFWISLLGSLFLGYLGISTLLAKPAEHAASAQGHGLLAAYVTTFALTITNPLTILSFVAIFAGLGLGIGPGATNYAAAALLVLGVFCGSALWWLILSGGVSLARGWFTPHAMLWINRVAGLVILGFGLWYGLALFFKP